jgi:hypothetical protein
MSELLYQEKPMTEEKNPFASSTTSGESRASNSNKNTPDTNPFAKSSNVMPADNMFNRPRTRRQPQVCKLMKTYIDFDDDDPAKSEETRYYMRRVNEKPAAIHTVTWKFKNVNYAFNQISQNFKIQEHFEDFDLATTIQFDYMYESPPVIRSEKSIRIIKKNKSKISLLSSDVQDKYNYVVEQDAVANGNVEDISISPHE